MPFYTPHVTAAAQDYVDAVASPDEAHRARYRSAFLRALRLKHNAPIPAGFLLDLAFSITDPKDHTFIGATSGDRYDPCRVCRGRKYDQRHGGVPAQPFSTDLGG